MIQHRKQDTKRCLMLAHMRLTLFAKEQGLHPLDWPDMALRVMLEYHRSGPHPRAPKRIRVYQRRQPEWQRRSTSRWH